MSTNRPARSSIAGRRRSSGSATKLLGAVKLQSPLGGGASDDAASPCTSSEPITPQDSLSPLADRQAASTAAPAGAAAAASTSTADDVVTQFSRLLTTSRSADRWLDERLTSSSAGSSEGPSAAAASSSRCEPVGSAAAQIVHDALRCITAEHVEPSSQAKKPSFDSQSILDKGLDAISGMTKLMEGFALTLDTVIGQAFDWGSSLQTSSRATKAWRPIATNQGEQKARPGSGASGKENAGQPGVSKQSSRRQPHMTSFMSKLDAASEHEVQEWRKRAQQLASELQRMREQQEEYQRLRQQYDKLQHDLKQASTEASKLAEENCQLKSRSLPPEADPALADPLAAQQVAKQMEALLREKSKLVQENDRLLRENTGLQELLEFSLVHQAQLAGEGELFGYDEEDDGCVLVDPLATTDLMAAEEGSSMSAAVPSDALPAGA